MQSASEDIQQTNNKTKRKRDGRTENRQKEDKAQVLTEIIEECTCLWELAEHETTSANVKSKVNALRSQIRREIAK